MIQFGPRTTTRSRSLFGIFDWLFGALKSLDSPGNILFNPIAGSLLLRELRNSLSQGASVPLVHGLQCCWICSMNPLPYVDNLIAHGAWLSRTNFPDDDATSVPPWSRCQSSVRRASWVTKNIRPGPCHSRRNDSVVSKRCGASA